RETQARMLIRYDVLLVPLDEDVGSVLQVKSQKREETVVEGHRDGHVLYRDFDVVDDRFHGSSRPGRQFHPSRLAERWRPLAVRSSRLLSGSWDDDRHSSAVIAHLS